LWPMMPTDFVWLNAEVDVIQRFERGALQSAGP
jgi:hypothetical protein